MALPPELDALLAARRRPLRLWWRDDDAGRATPTLDRLLDLAARYRAPVALAVVPRWLESACAERIARCPQASVLQHGIAHHDYAAPGERKIELGGTAALEALGLAVMAGRERLVAAFGPRFLPVMVPPWNRIAPPVLLALERWGFAGWSGWRGSPPDLAALRRVDTHLDAIEWRAGRQTRHVDALWADLAELLRAGVREPIGLLTHHLVTGDDGFAALDRFLRVVQDHPGLVLQDAGAAFGEAV